ncbi:MAG TPA: hypothetical protein VGC14_06435 [Rhizobium sp.]
MFIDQTEKHRATGRICSAVDLQLAAGYLCSFESIVAVTANACSVMTTTGVYRGVHVSQDTDLRNRGLRLYVHDSSLTEATVSPVDHASRLPPSIVFQERGGRVVHRSYMTSVCDELALDFLQMSLPACGPQADAKDARPFPVRGSRPLPLKTIDRQVIPHLLTYLTALRMPLTIAVCSGTCTHCDDGALDDVHRDGDLLFVRSGATALSFDPASIGSWRVRSELDIIRLEAVSLGGDELFYLTAGHRNHCNATESWSEILASLP